MTKEEFENLTAKEIAEVCRKTENCYKCPFTTSHHLWPCQFADQPEDWVMSYTKLHNKEGH